MRMRSHYSRAHISFVIMHGLDCSYCNGTCDSYCDGTVSPAEKSSLYGRRLQHASFTHISQTRTQRLKTARKTAQPKPCAACVQLWFVRSVLPCPCRTYVPCSCLLEYQADMPTVLTQAYVNTYDISQAKEPPHIPPLLSCSAEYGPHLRTPWYEAKSK